MRVVKEEIFGPVLTVMAFADEDEAVALANDTPYGLAGGVWTQDIQRAFRVSRRLDAGTIWVNTYRSSSYAVPFGGFKTSGLGLENGLESLAEYSRIKAVWIDVGGEGRDPFRLG